MIKAKKISGIPTHLLTDGEFYFDLPEDYGIRKSKSRSELDTENKVSQEVALSFTLPRSPGNDYFFADYAGAIDVWVWDNGEILEFDEIRLTETKDDGYEVEIYGSNWAEKLQRLRVRDVDLGEFEYTDAEIAAAWSDTTIMATPTLASYGGWNQEGSATLKDLRMWFNLTKVMRACFCAIGWQFESSVWDVWPFNRLYGYISGEHWYSYDGKQDPLRVTVANNSQIDFPGAVDSLIFPDTVYDPFNLYNSITAPGEYLYPPAGQTDIDLHFRFTGSITLPATPAGLPSPTWSLLLYQNRPATEELFFPFVEQYQGVPGEAQTITLNIDFRIEGVQAGDSFGIFVEYADKITPGGIDYPWTLNLGGECRFEPDPPRYIENDTINLGDLIDPNLNALDLFKGMQHMVSGIIKPDFNAKTISLYPPYQTSIDATVMEGFFLNSALDLTTKVQGGSLVKREITEQYERYLRLQFKESSDSFIESRNFPVQIWSKLVDTGGAKEETKTLENPIFEPTIERDTTVEEIGFLPDGSSVDATPALMALWDNEDGKLSKKLGYRIAYNHGLVEQLNSSGDPYQLVYEGVAISEFGYLSQWPTRRVSVAGFYRPVYGSSNGDFYTAFWRLKIVKDFYKKADFELLLWLTEQDYKELDFRKPVLVDYYGYRLFKALAVKDHRGSFVSTPVTLVEESENTIQ